MSQAAAPPGHVREIDVHLPDGRSLRAHDTGAESGDLAVVWHHGTPQTGALLPPDGGGLALFPMARPDWPDGAAVTVVPCGLRVRLLRHQPFAESEEQQTQPDHAYRQQPFARARDVLRGHTRGRDGGGETADLLRGVGLGVEQVDLARRAEVEDHDHRVLVVPLLHRAARPGGARRNGSSQMKVNAGTGRQAVH